MARKPKKPHARIAGAGKAKKPDVGVTGARTAKRPRVRRAAPALGKIAADRGISLHTASALNSARGLSAESLDTMPEVALKRAIGRLRYPDIPQLRTEFRRLHLRTDPTEGTLSQYSKVSRRMRALHHQDSLRLRLAANKATKTTVAGIPVGMVTSPGALSPQPLTAGVDQKTWNALGPGNVGGRTRCIVPDPDQVDRLWLGAAGGGVWRSDDAGVSWSPTDDLMLNLAVCSLAISPTKDSDGRRLMYAGTGEGFGNGDAIQGAGIFWSADGAQWTQLVGTDSVDFPAVNRIALSCDGAVILAATPTGLMRSTLPQPSSWTKVLTTAVADVRCHPTDATLAIAGGHKDGNSYYSTDGGATWTASTHDAAWGGRAEVTYAAADPKTVYASVDMNSGAIWKSADGGQTFTAVASVDAQGAATNYLGNQGWYANTIWAGDPGDANAVIVGGLDLYRSVDGGATLQQISLWYETASVHADHHCIVSDAQLGQSGAAKRVYFGNDGGVFRADDYTSVGANADRADGWTHLDNGYGVTQFFGVAGNAQSGNIIGGAQDNGTVLYTTQAGANGWTSMFGGDGGWCAADPGDANYFYGEYVYGQIHRSADAGVSAEYICGSYYDATNKAWAWRPAPYLIPDAQANRALFIAPFVMDPGDSSRILVGGASLWRTDDAKTANDNTALTGPTWAEIKAGLSDKISAIAISATNSSVIWVGHEAGQIFITANGADAQPQWQQIAGGAGFALNINRYCASICINDSDANDVYVSFAAYRGGTAGSNIWRTTDGGTTWNDVGQSLPDAPVHKITRHPTTAGYLYAGTEIGLFASEDSGLSWSPTNEGPTNAPVYEIIWLGNRLICTTHGRGMWDITV